MKSAPEMDENHTTNLKVSVFEKGGREKSGTVPCEIDVNLQFEITGLGTYFLQDFDTVIYDTMLVAAAIEYCDRISRRPKREWRRIIEVSIPVHEPDRWNERKVFESLHDLVRFLTGDEWSISFHRRKKPQPHLSQQRLAIDIEIGAVIPFSNGLDSRCVAGIMEKQLGRGIVRVRLNPKDDAKSRKELGRLPFASVPYSIQETGKRFAENSARSRGLKFAFLGGIAAFLGRTRRIIVPESGQGSLGPTLVPVGQGYEDYRCHPLFLSRVEVFLNALLNYKVRFEFPQLWKTKGQTLAQYLGEANDDGNHFLNTRSCWQGNRQVSVGGHYRQCGICAACMLRRLSFHTNNISEPSDAYVWEKLSSESFLSGAAVGFRRDKITPSMREYAIGGVLHLNHLANLTNSEFEHPMLNLRASQLEGIDGHGFNGARGKLWGLLEQHAKEWGTFLDSLGDTSFVAKWAGRG